VIISAMWCVCVCRRHYFSVTTVCVTTYSRSGAEASGCHMTYLHQRPSRQIRDYWGDGKSVKDAGGTMRLSGKLRGTSIVLVCLVGCLQLLASSTA
jgi:hypothetical protein